MGQNHAHFEIRDKVAIVTIHHPPMNVLDEATKEDLGAVFTELDDRRQEIRAVILRGSGNMAFAAGADLKAFLNLNPDTAMRQLLRSHEVYKIVENFEWPVIAAIHGYCWGGGWNWHFAVIFVIPKKYPSLVSPKSIYHSSQGTVGPNALCIISIWAN